MKKVKSKKALLTHSSGPQRNLKQIVIKGTVAIIRPNRKLLNFLFQPQSRLPTETVWCKNNENSEKPHTFKILLRKIVEKSNIFETLLFKKSFLQKYFRKCMQKYFRKCINTLFFREEKSIAIIL
jgi:hypothetical protein